MRALVDILQAFLFVGVIGFTAFYWGRQARRPKISLAQITLYRQLIEQSSRPSSSGNLNKPIFSAWSKASSEPIWSSAP